MHPDIQALKDALATAVDLTMASNVLEWDQETYMPEGGAQGRADQLATLREQAHIHYTSEEVGKLLEACAIIEEDLEYDSTEAGLIRVARREYERRTKIPPALVNEIETTSALGVEAWKKARANDDFAAFLPPLEKLIDLKMQEAECFAPYDHVYNPLMDYYEPGLTVDQVDVVFAGLRPPLVELVAGIVANQDAVDTSILADEWDGDAQIAFSRQVAADLGYDFERGRLDLAAHPFSISHSVNDVRITTRVHTDNLASCLMSVVHEAGHGMYEQFVDPSFYRTLLSEGAGMAAHESQSRFYENILGRSRAFWRHYFPTLQAAFPQIKGEKMETFYRALNQSTPSLIRVEADEVTYGLHIMLRYELEKALFEGKVKAADLPREWNERMEAYLGIVPPSNADGVLQDIHWAAGLFGYFPDYLLGSIFSVQLWNQMQADIPDVEAQVERGDFSQVTDWNKEKIHQHGKKYTLPELTARVVGGPLAWEPYMDYLSSKYGEIYGI